MEAHNLHHSDNSEVDSDFEEEAEYEHTVQQATAHLAAQRSVQIIRPRGYKNFFHAQLN